MEKDIKILEKLANRTYKIDKDGWETAVCSIDEQLAIRNLIARNKELEAKIDVNNWQHNEEMKYMIPESKVRKILEKDIGQYMQFYRDIEELLQEGDK